MSRQLSRLRIWEWLGSKTAYGSRTQRFSSQSSRLRASPARSFSSARSSTPSYILRSLSRQQRAFHNSVKHDLAAYPFRPRQTNTSHLSRRIRSRRFSTKNSPKTSPTSPPPSEQEPQSLSARLRKLSREYGWSALGVYFLLTALDFPFCFAAVRSLGVDRIGHWEHVVVETVKGAFGSVWPFAKRTEGGTDDAANKRKGEHDQAYDHGVAEAQRRNEGAEASIWTQLAFAYAIHKSFIFIRVPLTAAITPKVVRTLRGWGWNIGKRKAKLPKSN